MNMELYFSKCGPLTPSVKVIWAEWGLVKKRLSGPISILSDSESVGKVVSVLNHPR